MTSYVDVTSSRPAGAEGVNEFGQVETRGIDHIPDHERRGHPRELFTVWAASNVNYLSIVVGGVLTQIGLNAWQALVVLVLGCTFWVFAASLAVSGPSAGTPSYIVTRAIFGVRGNRLLAGMTWLLYVMFEAINLSIAAMAAFALMKFIGIEVARPLQMVIVAILAVATLAISVYGHRTIVKLSTSFAIVVTAIGAMLMFFIVPRLNLAFVPQSAPQGAALWGVLFLGFTIIASGPLSWFGGADYSRYLPRSTPAKSIIGWSSLGAILPAFLFGLIGVMAGTVVDMTDPQTSFVSILPPWAYLVFLLVIVVGTTTSNIMTTYSSGLILQAAGVTASRSKTVLIDGIIAVAIACYALFISNFFTTLLNFLPLSVALFAPTMAIYVTDIVLRRNRYDGLGLNDETAGSPYWYRSGVNWSAAAAQVLGTIVALLCINTPVFAGPVSTALAGADLSALAGPLVAALVYAATFRK
jgi:nucleobase:cation symporter-1, NCS1 family